MHLFWCFHYLQIASLGLLHNSDRNKKKHTFQGGYCNSSSAHKLKIIDDIVSKPRTIEPIIRLYVLKHISKRRPKETYLQKSSSSGQRSFLLISPCSSCKQPFSTLFSIIGNEWCLQCEQFQVTVTSRSFYWTLYQDHA